MVSDVCRNQPRQQLSPLNILKEEVLHQSNLSYFFKTIWKIRTHFVLITFLRRCVNACKPFIGPGICKIKIYVRHCWACLCKPSQKLDAILYIIGLWDLRLQIRLDYYLNTMQQINHNSNYYFWEMTLVRLPHISS